jgi:RimJ/RimL family protein N-acetyltransferase
MTDGLRLPELRVPGVRRQPALILRPWRVTDISALAAEMSREYPAGGMWSGPGERPVRTALPGGAERRAGPDGERDAARWIASQDRGWHDGDRLSFAVLEADDAGGCVLAGNAGLKNREETGRIGERETAEIGYWTAVAARGRSIAPAAASAVTGWAFEAFARQASGRSCSSMTPAARRPAAWRRRPDTRSGNSARRARRAGTPTGTSICGWPADAQPGTTLPVRPAATSRPAAARDLATAGAAARSLTGSPAASR